MELKDKVTMVHSSLQWARRTHEIVRYRPEDYDHQGIYTRDSWMDYSDVGREFEGEIFTEEEYLKIEAAYIKCAAEIMRRSGCSYLTIGYVEKNNRKKSLAKYRYRSRIYIDDLADLLREMLRGHIYCFLANIKRKFYLDVGYDYYMCIICPIDWDTLNDIVKSYGLFLDPRSSRYDNLRLNADIGRGATEND